MLIERVILDDYIPFSHSNIEHVDVSFVAPCTAIIGPNGCGKSSMLRSITPFPACRTSYGKRGRIVLFIRHNGVLYELSSDFSKPVNPHSFKMHCENGVIEKNESGSESTQRDLVLEYLEYNQLFDDILSGNVHICDMQKAHRKQLFSSAYPSDLSFVLEYHKKVCSHIRAFGSQIKLLQGREGSLLASLIDENERNRLTEWKNNAQALITRIDQINLLLENEISQLQTYPELKVTFDNMTVEQMQTALRDYVQKYREHLLDWNHGSKFGEVIDKQSLKDKIVEFDKEADFANKKKDSIYSDLETVRDEIDKFTRLKNTPTSDKKDELANELRLIKEEMEILKQDPNWQNAPSIQQQKLSAVEALVADLGQITAVLHPYAGKLIGNETIQKLNAENDSLSVSCSNFMSEKVGIEHMLKTLMSRREMITQNSYPKDCDRVCGLRATLEASVRDLDLQIKELTARKENLDELLKNCTDQLDANKALLQEVSPAIPVMKRLYDKLTENFLVDLALDGESFVTCLNEHCAEIPNRILKGLSSSKIYYRYKELYDRSEAITNTLAMMKTNEAANLSLEVIDDIIKDRQKKLDQGIAELDHLDRQLIGLNASRADASDMYVILSNIEGTIGNIQKQFNYSIIKCRLDFDRKLIEEHTAIRNVLSERLREVEYTLNDQKRIMDVLDTEIRPTLDSLRKQKVEWEMVEYGLSPTKGLPCIYLIRFINRLIEKTNRLIKRIWFCDMELAYLDEKETLDFTLSLILNKSSTVKDISVCSNGQKAVIDLCMTFALCQERGLLDNYVVKLDECDAALTEMHRLNLVQMLSDMLNDGEIRQLLLVNHFAIQTGLSACDTVALSTEGIVIPGEYNEHALVA